MTTSAEKCPQCGGLVPSKAPGGLCPRCLVAMNLGAPTQAPTGAGGTQVSPAREGDSLPVAEVARLFPQLEIQECLGRGGMGAVYRARQPQLNRLVALKILARGRGSDPAFAERFKREAQALARLNHPGIVAVHDFGEVGGHCFLLMEYVDGANLRQLLLDQKLSPSEALAIVPQLCDALQYAHAQGIVHRDIKPENILLDTHGRVKIADFGIAKMLSAEAPARQLTGEKDVIGTPHYMAPEQIEKPQTVDHRADIYSLGVVFYEMLTGELPLGKFQAPSRKVQVDVRLDDVVLRSLEKEPARRYQHVGQVKTDVEVIATTPGAGGPPGLDRLGKWVRAARWAGRLLGTLLLAFYGFFVLAEGLPPIAGQPEGVQLNFIALGFMLAGFVVGWRREGTAALLIASGWTLWQVSESSVRWNLFQTPLPVGALFAFCWWAKSRKTALLGGVLGALAVSFVLGRLFCPANVFIRGVVSDAASGRPLADAEVRLLRNDQPESATSQRANARTSQDGSFTLYVGWYAANRRVAVTAAAHETLVTHLGPRPLGQRQMRRDFRLAPAALALPPVVVQTIPAAGSAGVDPALTEIRVTFSMDMDPGRWSWNAWDEKAFPLLAGQPRYLADGRTCVLPVRLEPGKTYAVWLNSDTNKNFRSRQGSPSVPYLLIFQTRK